MVNQIKFEEGIEKLRTDLTNEIHASIQSIKDTVIQKLLESNQMLQNKVTTLEKQVLQLQIDHETSNQYNRQNNILISGTPSTVDHEDLENVAVKLLNKVNAPSIVNNRDFEACHRVSEKSNVVVCRLVNRKDVEQALSNRGKLKNLNPADIDLPPSTGGIYLNEHLTPYFSKLAFYCRRLKKKNCIKKCPQIKGSSKFLDSLMVIRKHGRE